jgi:hypothetical protein
MKKIIEEFNSFKIIILGYDSLWRDDLHEPHYLRTYMLYHVSLSVHCHLSSDVYMCVF